VTGDRLRQHYDGRRVCVTGGAGFIGSHLCAGLAEVGADVAVIDDLSTGRASNLPAGARLVEGSILDARALADACDGATVVFHLAAHTSVPRSMEEPAGCFEVNATGTLEVLEAARAAGAGRVVFASSSSVYGDQPAQPKVETMSPDPRSPYAASKLAGEMLLATWARAFGLSSVSLRYFNIFGPRQRPDSPYAAVIPRFAEALLAGRAATIYGDGLQTRDFTPVANAVHANLLAGACPDDLDGEPLNVACGVSCTVLELADAVAAALGLEPRLEHAPARAGDVLHSRASIDAARARLGYEPLVGFEAGLAETVAWYRETIA
jgi:nucleoside-diphosphate-sugar epimerase